MKITTFFLAVDLNANFRCMFHIVRYVNINQRYNYSKKMILHRVKKIKKGQIGLTQWV